MLRIAQLPSIVLLSLAATAISFHPQDDLVLGATAAYQGPQASDAFSAIHHAGGGRIIAGKRSSAPGNRFLLSVDSGTTWSVRGCPGSTGSHTYFFGQNGSTLMAGTGDTGQACVMRSTDTGSNWTVALSHGDLNALIGSSNAQAVFGVVHLGSSRWLANVKAFDTSATVIMSGDDGLTWRVPANQPGAGPGSWARQMIRTGDGVILWPSVLTDRMYRSMDDGTTWSFSVVPGAQLFQPLCDAGNGIYFCGEATTSPSAPIRLFRSETRGLNWHPVAEVNLQRPTTTYWRDVIHVNGILYASACCVEATSNDRNMQIFRSKNTGKSWESLGNPYQGPFGGMQAIYQMCATPDGDVFAGCQPDSTILTWRAR